MTKIPAIIVLIVITCFAAFAQKTDSTNLSSDVQIIKSPKANYTDQARQKSVKGMVILKVTFLANGEIGEITDVTKKKRAKLIKYGLTAQAIEAARKITFIPAKDEKGNPVDLTKVVEYGFTVY